VPPSLGAKKTFFINHWLSLCTSNRKVPCIKLHFLLVWNVRTDTNTKKHLI